MSQDKTPSHDHRRKRASNPSDTVDRTDIGEMIKRMDRIFHPPRRETLQKRYPTAQILPVPSSALLSIWLAFNDNNQTMSPAVICKMLDAMKPVWEKQICWLAFCASPKENDLYFVSNEDDFGSVDNDFETNCARCDKVIAFRSLRSDSEYKKGHVNIVRWTHTSNAVTLYQENVYEIVCAACVCAQTNNVSNVTNPKSQGSEQSPPPAYVEQ